MLSVFNQVTDTSLAVVKGPERRRAPPAFGRADRRGECFVALDAPQFNQAPSRGVGELASPAPLPRGERESARGTPRLRATGALGRNGKSVVRTARSEGDERRRWLFRLQDAAAKLLPEHPVAGCGRKPALCVGEPWSESRIQIPVIVENGRASYQGLHQCSGKWVCPVCASRITSKRAAELVQAVNGHRLAGGVVMMITLTAAHTAQDRLADWLGKFLAAEKAWKQRRSQKLTKARKARMEVPRAGWATINQSVLVGHVKGLEVNCSWRNGWHPHTHTLLFFKPGIAEEECLRLAESLRASWYDALARKGLRCTEVGFDVRNGDAMAEYLAKYGHPPASTTRLWGAAQEMSLTIHKMGRLKGRTPWQLLADYIDGDREAGRRFQEFAEVFYGRRQLVWSPGLKDHFGLRERTDEQLAADPIDEADVRTAVGELSISQFRAISRAGFRAVMLDWVENHGRAGFDAAVRVAHERVGKRSSSLQTKWEGLP